MQVQSITLNTFINKYKVNVIPSDKAILIDNVFMCTLT